MTLVAGADAGEKAGGRRFAPVAVKAEYPPPRATIDPDRAKSWLARALPVVLAHKRSFVVALTASFVGLVLQVQIPQLMNEAIDKSIALHEVPLAHYVYLVLALATGAGLLGFVSRYFLMRTAYSIEYDLRSIVFRHLSTMSFSFYDRVQTGQLISRANSDIRSVNLYLTFAPSILVQSAIAAVAFAYMLSIDVPLAFVAMSTMPFVYVLGVRMRRSMFPVSWLIQARLADVATIVDENTAGVRIVKSFAAEARELNRLARAADRLQWSYVKDADLRARFSPMVQNLPPLGLAMVLLLGGYLVVDGHLGVGAIVAFSFYIAMLQAPFQMLGMLIMMGQRASASAQRVYEILDEKPQIVDRPGAVDLVHCHGEVRFESVFFSYTDAGPAVIRGLDLLVPPGETVAIVGPTGSGKSTIARLLVRFYDVDSGAVKVDGHDVRDLTLESLRSHIGLVLDDPFLFSASVRDNIAFSRPDAPDDEVVEAARAAGADEFIRQLDDGYDTVVGERGYTLSGGQRQRIAIARALLANPPILVLDDATSAVDVQVELQIHDALRQLMRGRTTIVVAHRLSTISLADRVVLFEEGTITAEGTHAELMDSCPRYVEVLAQAEERDRLRAPTEPPRDATSRVARGVPPLDAPDGLRGSGGVV
jgi:ATP-binding cassette subfamily B protein